MVEWWYNTSFHSTSKMTPYEIVYGVPPPQLISYILGTTKIQAVEEELKIRDQVISVQLKLSAAQERMKHFADRHWTEREFALGDWEYLKLQPYRQVSVSQWKSLKFAPRYYGHFQIIQKNWNCCIQIKTAGRFKRYIQYSMCQSWKAIR